MKFFVIALIFAVPIASIQATADEDVTITFNITQSIELYEASDWGEPAQAAIWLEDPATGNVRTVWVTSRTATGNFLGKVECPNSLPAWIGVFRAEFGRDDYPTPQKPIPDAVTGATTRAEKFSVKTTVPSGTTLNYYIEVNVSGDFNAAFATFTDDGRPDQYGCGQPSLVYKGTIHAKKDATSKPKIIGRTRRMIRSSEIINELTGIESAIHLYKHIEVICE
ncbi:hypothetical protein ACFLT7_04390 [candidate division KSB1 bacterium]